jgi:hypothetical protein
VKKKGKNNGRQKN